MGRDQRAKLLSHMNRVQSKTDRYVRSSQAFDRARALMPGGVNSPVRAYQAVGREPVVVRQGRGARVIDVDGNEYLDYVASYGPLILGHAHPCRPGGLE